VRRQLDLAAALGAQARDERLAVALPESARAGAAEALSEAGVDPDAPWAVVHPGATAASRRYPEDRWALACRALAGEHGVRLVFTGDSAEVAVAERVRRLAEDPGPSLAGRLSLAELAALLEAAPVLLAGNTGPVHLAAAVGTPVVDVYALTNPQHAPWMVPSRVLYQDVPCRWCYSSVCREGHHRCVLGVTPEQIVTAALDLMAGRPQPEVVLPPVPAGWERRPPRDIGKEAAWRR
jgi:ADP-heptose:LPS heptosyltransferase